MLLSENSIDHDRFKHIDMRVHTAREKVINGDVTLSQVPIDVNLAGILTKGLPTNMSTFGCEWVSVVVRRRED